MTNREISGEYDELAYAYQVLNEATHDEELQALATKPGPLKMSELKPGLRNSDAFRGFVSEYGWPNELEDSSIVPPPKFSDEQFLGALSSEGAVVEGKNYQLNNFKVWLDSAPNTEGFSGNASIYGANPALLRAYVIEPEFMMALRTAYRALPKRVYPTDEALYSKEGELVVRGAHTAFRLLARLLKTTDEQLQTRILFGKDGGLAVNDALTTLSR